MEAFSRSLLLRACKERRHSAAVEDSFLARASSHRGFIQVHWGPSQATGIITALGYFVCVGGLTQPARESFKDVFTKDKCVFTASTRLFQTAKDWQALNATPACIQSGVGTWFKDVFTLNKSLPWTGFHISWSSFDWCAGKHAGSRQCMHCWMHRCWVFTTKQRSASS